MTGHGEMGQRGVGGREKKIKGEEKRRAEEEIVKIKRKEKILFN